jgi:hypothetical protein
MRTLSHADDRVERGDVATPVIDQDRSVCAAQDVPQDQGRHDRVVKRPGHGDEFRDQVYRRDEPHQGEPQPSLAAPRDARITDQAPEQDHEVREQGGHLACLRSPPERHEGNDRQQPQANREHQGDQQAAEHPGKPTTSRSAVRGSGSGPTRWRGAVRPCSRQQRPRNLVWNETKPKEESWPQ